jgi:hypothetical protein
MFNEAFESKNVDEILYHHKLTSYALPNLIMFICLHLLVLLQILFMNQHKFNHLINKIHLMNHILLVLTNLLMLREVDFHVFQF